MSFITARVDIRNVTGHACIHVVVDFIRDVTHADLAWNYPVVVVYGTSKIIQQHPKSKRWKMKDTFVHKTRQQQPEQQLS
jgi:acetylglutamate kinase